MSESNNTVKEKFNDYENCPVPKEVHLSWIDQGTVWIGVGFCLAAIATGGVLANGLAFKDMLIAAFIGSIILTLIAILTGYIGSITHLSSSYTAGFCLGKKGAKILGVVFAFSLFGWFAFQADLFGITIVEVIKTATGKVYPSNIFTILGALAMMITAIVGYKGIQYLSRVGVPLLFLLSIVALYKTFSIVPWSEIVNAGPAGESISLPLGIAAVVGNFAVGVVLVSDFSRYSRTPKDATIGSILGYFIGYIPILLLGAIFTYAFKNWNIVEVMLGSLGMGVIGAIVLIISQWTTNDNNLYQSVLGLSNTLQGASKLPRWKLTVIVGLISTAIAGIGLYKYYLDFLIIITSTIPPIAGVMFADFYLLKNREKYQFEKYNGLPDYNKKAIISWVFGALIGLSMTNPPTGFGIGFMVNLANIVPIPLAALFGALILYTIIGSKK
ncbi:MAG: cytosine permease [Clostridia bacterium]|nr:cytosine permease [Clostridia bacterium]